MKPRTHTTTVRITYDSERAISPVGIEVLVVKAIMGTYADGITSIEATVIS